MGRYYNQRSQEDVIQSSMSELILFLLFFFLILLASYVSTQSSSGAVNDGEFNRLQTRIDVLNGEQQDLSGLVERLGNEKSTLAAHVSELEKAVGQREDQINILGVQIEDLQREYRKEVESKGAEIQRLKNRRDELLSLIMETTNEISKHEDHVLKLGEIIRKGENQISQLGIQLEDLQREYGKEVESKDARIRKSEKNVAKHSKLLIDAELKSKNLSEEKRKITDRLVTWN